MTRLDAPAPKPMPKVLGRYEVRAKIGEGGMAVVYAGRQVGGAGPDRVVALKVIKDEFSLSRDFVHMFIDEARIAAKLWHPNIVKVFELGNEGGRLFIVMELLSGESLLELWEASRARGKRLPFEVAAWMGARVAEGLHHAHELRDAAGNPQHVIHRDVNPSNVLVTFDGEVKIIDFGLAKAVNRVSKTAAGIVKGKLAYLSPEQAIGLELDRRADIFSLGTTLWELTVDRRLFRQADDIETLKRIHAAVVPDPSTLVPDYPPALWAVIKRSLAKDRDERYPTAEALARDLDAFAQGSGSIVNAQSVAAMMQEVFAEERERQAAWIRDVSAPRPGPMVTLKPPSNSSAGLLPMLPAAAPAPAAAKASPPSPGSGAGKIAPARLPLEPEPTQLTARPAARGPGRIIALAVAAFVVLVGILTMLLRR